GRLARPYEAGGPCDPDGGRGEEGEGPGLAPVSAAYLRDDVIDAVYEALAGLPEDLVVRRPGEREGVRAAGGRGVLLAFKARVKRDWHAGSVLARLERHASVAVDAGPVIVHARDDAPDAALTRLAAETLGRRATVHAHRGGVTGVL